MYWTYFMEIGGFHIILFKEREGNIPFIRVVRHEEEHDDNEVHSLGPSARSGLKESFCDFRNNEKARRMRVYSESPVTLAISNDIDDEKESQNVTLTKRGINNKEPMVIYGAESNLSHNQVDDLAERWNQKAKSQIVKALEDHADLGQDDYKPTAQEIENEKLERKEENDMISEEDDQYLDGDKQDRAVVRREKDPEDMPNIDAEKMRDCYSFIANGKHLRRLLLCTNQKLSHVESARHLETLEFSKKVLNVKRVSP